MTFSSENFFPFLFENKELEREMKRNSEAEREQKVENELLVLGWCDPIIDDDNCYLERKFLFFGRTKRKNKLLIFIAYFHE